MWNLLKLVPVPAVPDRQQGGRTVRELDGRFTSSRAHEEFKALITAALRWTDGWTQVQRVGSTRGQSTTG